MGVVSPERTPTPTAPPPERQPPPEPPRRRVPWGLIAVGLLVVSLVAGYNWARDLWPSFDNPFQEETVDRSGPAVLKSIQSIGEYRAATGHFEVIVDLEKDTALPSELLGERTLFVAVGRVDSGVDLSGLGPDSVAVSGNRTAATITVPRAQLFDAEVDIERSYVYDRRRGVLNEIAGLFSDQENYQQELYALAKAKLNEAAQQGAGLVPRAEANTRAMLVGLLTALGFAEVTVRFED